MVKVNKDVKGKDLECSVYLDGYLESNLRELARYVDHKFDAIGFIVGREGSGKSVFAAQLAYFLDSNLSLNNIVFTSEQFLEAVNNSPVGSCIVWDEADELGTHWASNILQTLKRTFKRIRKNRLFILLVTPTVFDMNKYFVIQRTLFLIHVYTNGVERGYFRFFNYDRKKDLYLNGQKQWNMGAAKPNFIGRFMNMPSGFPVDYSDEGEYNKKKDDATKSLAEEQLSPKELERKVRRDVLSAVVFGVEQEFKISLSTRQLGRWLGVSKDTINRDLKSSREGEI